MKLATFDKPIQATIQGDGVLVGVPMVFVRLHGCDYSCSFCDTKDSWKPGSASMEMSVDQVAQEIRSHALRWVSVTGGNPLLQAEELVTLMDLLPDHRFLVETQASVFDPRVFQRVSMASLSPKLHDWRWSTLNDILLAMKHRVFDPRPIPETQIKVVVTSEIDTWDALRKFETIHGWWTETKPRELPEPHYILLPEYSLGRSGVRQTHAVLSEWNATRPASMVVRIIPQIHKLALFVP